MGFLARRVKHRPVAVLIYHVTGGRARLGDSDGLGLPPITDEAIPHIRGELSGFATLIPLHDPVTLPVGDRVQQASFRLRVKRFLHLLIDPLDQWYFCCNRKKLN